MSLSQALKKESDYVTLEPLKFESDDGNGDGNIKQIEFEINVSRARLRSSQSGKNINRTRETRASKECWLVVASGAPSVVKGAHALCHEWQIMTAQASTTHSSSLFFPSHSHSHSFFLLAIIKLGDTIKKEKQRTIELIQLA